MFEIAGGIVLGAVGLIGLSVLLVLMGVMMIGASKRDRSTRPVYTLTKRAEIIGGWVFWGGIGLLALYADYPVEE